MSRLPCPFDFTPLTNNASIVRDFLGYDELGGLVSSRPGGWVLGGRYGQDWAEEIYNMELRPDDVWVVSYPKSGTTWTQHMTWLLLNDLEATSDRPDKRSPFIDLDQCTPKKKFISEMEAKLKALEEGEADDGDFLPVLSEELSLLRDWSGLGQAAAMPTERPRLIKSHLPFCLMNPDVVKKNKVIYIARDPRDVCISYFHHHRLIRHHEFIGGFKEFFNYFINEQVLWAPFWRHVSQAWVESKKQDSNVLFLFYSDMKKDLVGEVKRVAAFLDKSLSDDQLAEMQKQLSHNSMKDNPAANETELMIKLGVFKAGEGDFMRLRDGLNDYNQYYTPEMKSEMEAWKEAAENDLELPMQKLWADSNPSWKN